MKKRHSTIDTHATAIFLQAAHDGSFTLAAKRLCMTPSSVSKAISRLEEDLGATLLHRSPRNVTLTPAGARFFDEAECLALAIERARGAVRESTIALKRKLRVVLPIHFGRSEVAPYLSTFIDRNPEVDLEYFLFNNGKLDLTEYNFDVTVVVGRTLRQESNLICENFASFDSLLCASPAYLERYGTPKSITALDSHRTLGGIDDNNRGVLPWLFNTGGQTIEHSPRFNILSNSIDVLLTMAISGGGIVNIPSYIAGDPIQSGKLSIVLPRTRLEPMMIQIIYPKDRANDIDVKAFVDFLAGVIEKRRSSIKLVPHATISSA